MDQEKFTEKVKELGMKLAHNWGEDLTFDDFEIIDYEEKPKKRQQAILVYNKLDSIRKFHVRYYIPQDRLMVTVVED